LKILLDKKSISGDFMTERESPLGKTTIAPEVLVNIARLTALNTQGVSKLADSPDVVNRLFKQGVDEGVSISVQDNIVYIDLYLILQRDVNVRNVSRAVQKSVSRAISEMVGMEVGSVNIHVEDIDYGPEEKHSKS